MHALEEMAQEAASLQAPLALDKLAGCPWCGAPTRAGLACSPDHAKLILDYPTLALGVPELPWPVNLYQDNRRPVDDYEPLGVSGGMHGAQY